MRQPAGHAPAGFSFTHTQPVGPPFSSRSMARAKIISLNIQHGYRSAAGNLAVVMLSFGGGNACVRTFCPLALTCAASWYYAPWFRLCEYAGAADGW